MRVFGHPETRPVRFFKFLLTFLVYFPVWLKKLVLIISLL